MSTPGESPLRLPVLCHPPRPLTGRRRWGDDRLRKVGLDQNINNNQIKFPGFDSFFLGGGLKVFDK